MSFQLVGRAEGLTDCVSRSFSAATHELGIFPLMNTSLAYRWNGSLDFLESEIIILDTKKMQRRTTNVDMVIFLVGGIIDVFFGS